MQSSHNISVFNPGCVVAMEWLWPMAVAGPCGRVFVVVVFLVVRMVVIRILLRFRLTSNVLNPTPHPWALAHAASAPSFALARPLIHSKQHPGKVVVVVVVVVLRLLRC
jgi:hypothetical protein